jgi:hypothetical protein
MRIAVAIFTLAALLGAFLPVFAPPRPQACTEIVTPPTADTALRGTITI